MEENQILDLLFERNERAIEESDAIYGKRLYNLAFCVLRNREDAGECVNDSELEGNYVVLLQENETRVVYGHRQEIIISEGQSVSKGEQIAALGQTGMTTGSCLSLRVIVDGKEVNPLK